MPKGPQGQKRPADAIARAVMVAQIATGEIEEVVASGSGRATGGIRRAEVLTEAKRKEIASSAAKARWRSKDMELKMSELSLLKQELFGDSSSAISDIKFYPGESTECSPEDIAGAIRAAISDVRNGNGEDIDLSF